MSRLLTVGTLAGAFFYAWATPKTAQKVQIKMSWKDAAILIVVLEP